MSWGLCAYYRTSLWLGLRGLSRRHLKACASRLLNPLSYPRHMEYRLAMDGIAPVLERTGGSEVRVLDLGSPKLPIYLLARAPDLCLHSTDIRDYFIPEAEHFLRTVGAGNAIGKRIFLETQDGRALTYPDACFHAIYSISVIEHIPDDGDTAAIRELARVLKPGGRLALTTPYDGAAYQEEWVASDVYERKREGPEKVFYQRRYDEGSLSGRLIAPAETAGLRLVSKTYFGEPGLRFERYWNAVPQTLRLPLLWTAPFLAKLFLKVLPESRRDRAVGVALVFEKPSSDDVSSDPRGGPRDS